METESGPNPREQTPATTAPSPRKRWWVIAAGAVAMAFLAALGSWLFSLVRPMLDEPFDRPLEVLVEDSGANCDSYAVPATLLGDVPVDAAGDDPDAGPPQVDGEWIVAHGGLPTGSRTIGLTLHGSGEETVVIHDIEVVDFEPLTPSDEMVVIHECLPPSGDMGSAMDVSSLTVDFAGRPPVLELTDPGLRFPYEVSKTDPEVFDIFIDDPGDDEEACFCRWNIGITWSAGDELEHTVVEGESIGVATAIPSSTWTEYWYVDGDWTADLTSR